ncbi:bifunctional diguanylate cyclase/phosphodiesterase [Vreelandella piezotolerans]|uniref:EAL domain-containing protein n=1 Tax=Vreelandella piezotolerans TaxID=2609667 RepID=A0ABQ6X9N2_9GAMM|nr:EAL domain-containing protein [Halomonas piezotolerans]KAE8438720.1 EAL domain-containing protein [Halomonas piezotolerans]QJA25484.1 EAL domain-containing protein [Halomonas piezotolerans]
MHTRKEAAEIFRQLAEGVGRSSQPNFFASLVEQLARLLAVDHALIAVVTDANIAETLAVWSSNGLQANITYPLAGTPCETVVGHEPCLYACDVQSRFPEDDLLRQLGADSYMGLPLFGPDGAAIGLLAVLSNRPMAFDGLENEVLRIAAAQAGAELGRRQAENALRKSEAAAKESERRLNTLLDHLPGMAYRCLNDHDWTMLLVSQGAEALTGYRPEELENSRVTTFASLVHADDQARLAQEVAAAIRQRRPYRVTFRIRHRDGSERWMWEQGQAVFSNQGEVLCLEGFITDVTDQQEAQRVQQAVVQVASTVTSRVGDDYFQQLIATLTTLLEADAGFIALLDQPVPPAPQGHSHPNNLLPATTGHTVSLVVAGQTRKNHTFLLRGTPVERVVLEQESVVQQGQRFSLPGATMNAQAWIGRRLDNAKGEAIGVMMVFYQTPLTTNAFATSVLQILSTGAAAELERRRDHRHMHQLAYTDSTTGLPNRVQFMDLLRDIGERAEQQASPLALLLLDLRRFKEVNDLHGHQVGDQLLATVAARLRHLDIANLHCARLSGDEFALLLPRVERAALDELVKQLCSLVRRPIRLEHRVFNLDVSIGFARYPGDVANTSELFNAASIALHHAKKRETNISPYTQAMRHTLERRQWMTERLHMAILEQRLELYFQPQVDLDTKALTGAEALCRWHDPEWGWVSPGEFIPLAEERGLIRLLGDWVLEEAARQLSAWQAAGTPLPGRLSINISAQQFADPRLTTHIAALTSSVSPSAIAIELTESDFMRDPDQAVIITQAMRQAGYALFIDDFGTGYSSLSYLRRFAADALKIDISFVREMLDNHHDRAIVQTIIAMANTLDMKTLAEGVESAAQAALLAEMGCNQAQGYFFGKPLPADRFAQTWLSR